MVHLMDGGGASRAAADRLIDLTAAEQAVRPTRVLVAHEVRLFAEVLRVALSAREGFEVLPTIVPLAQAVQAARRAQPNVVIMDVEGASADGLQVLRDLRQSVPCAFVLVITASTDVEALSAAISAGASGYLTMDADMTDVVESVRAAAAGKVILSGRRLELLVRHLSQRAEKQSAAATFLTPREHDVLRLLAAGKSTAAIAVELGVRQNTARTHIQNLLSKLGCHSRLEAAALAVRQHLV